MRQMIRALIVLAILLWGPASAVGQGSELETREGLSEEQRLAKAKALEERARKRLGEGDLDGALRDLRGAYHFERDARFIYKQIKILERAGRDEEALSLLRDKREELVESDAVDGSLKQLELELEQRIARAKGQGGGTATGQDGGQAWVPWTLGLGGTVLTLTGATLVVLGFVQMNDLASSCARDISGTSPSSCPDGISGPIGAAYRDEVNSARTMAAAGWGVAALGLGALGGWLLYSLWDDQDAPAPKSAKVEVLPSWSPQGGQGVHLRWRF